MVRCRGRHSQRSHRYANKGRAISLVVTLHLEGPCRNHCQRIPFNLDQLADLFRWIQGNVLSETQKGFGSREPQQITLALKAHPVIQISRYEGAFF